MYLMNYTLFAIGLTCGLDPPVARLDVNNDDDDDDDNVVRTKCKCEKYDVC